MTGPSTSPADPLQTAAILATGDELLSGMRVDTNSSYLQNLLQPLGIAVVECRQVGDRQEHLVTALRELAARAQVLLVTGGLGPTPDDLTREALAEFSGNALVRSDEAEQQLRSFFAARGSVPSPSNLRQADLPRGASGIPNPRGTAPGIRLHHESALVFALPGVPHEMRHMAREEVLPYLRRQRLGPGTVDVTLQTAGLPESVIGERLGPIMRRGQPRVGITAHGGSISVSIRDRGDEGGRERIRRTQAEIHQLLDPYVFGAGRLSLAEHVGHRLLERGATLALAESCTGGLLASQLTEVPGISAAFLEGCVTYSNDAKTRTLGVPESMLVERGAVSEEVAEAMAIGVRVRARSTYGIGITGVAGPGGGTEDKPVGLVYVALADARETVCRKLQIAGDRLHIRQVSASAALDLLRRTLDGVAPPI